MDATTNNFLGGSGLIATILGVAFAVYKAVNHHRVRSSCCGKKLEVSLDVEQTTPPNTVRPEDEKTEVFLKPTLFVKRPASEAAAHEEKV